MNSVKFLVKERFIGGLKTTQNKVTYGRETELKLYHFIELKMLVMHEIFENKLNE